MVALAGGEDSWGGGCKDLRMGIADSGVARRGRDGVPRGGEETVAASGKKQRRPRMASPGSDDGERRELRARGGDERGMAAPSEAMRQPREWGIDGKTSSGVRTDGRPNRQTTTAQTLCY
uniref:DUF834 domain-containing protein n=1 Tax=Oryza glumipatula TaxID=40148 RepID=A0A0D9Z768_9ORYZ